HACKPPSQRVESYGETGVRSSRVAPRGCRVRRLAWTADVVVPDGIPRRLEPTMAGTTGIVPFWKQYDRRAVLRFAQLAEDLGYDSIWIPEAWGYEQFQLLTEIALSTKRIGLATGIANVFSRSPGLLAMSTATLDEISEGRAILGLGSSV